MKAERLRLIRLRRLERLRAIAKQAAATEAARAEGARAQLEGLAERTQAMASDYARRREVHDGSELQLLLRFAGGLEQMRANTAGDAQQARLVADARLADLAGAERRRAAVDTRARETAQRLARSALGTGLE